jgi:hypothetical protein
MKKNILLMILCLSLATGTAVAQYYGSGKGTESAPFLISSRVHIEELAKMVNGGATYEGHHFKLTTDLTGITAIIGNTLDCFFSGIFDGGRHSQTKSFTKAKSQTDNKAKLKTTASAKASKVVSSKASNVNAANNKFVAMMISAESENSSLYASKNVPETFEDAAFYLMTSCFVKVEKPWSKVRIMTAVDIIYDKLQDYAEEELGHRPNHPKEGVRISKMYYASMSQVIYDYYNNPAPFGKDMSTLVETMFYSYAHLFNSVHKSDADMKKAVFHFNDCVTAFYEMKDYRNDSDFPLPAYRDPYKTIFNL